MTKKQGLTSDRIWYFDLLRIVATFGVVFLHIMAIKWYDVEVKSFEWQVFNFGDTFVRWCVPIFVMISGALFLDTEVSIRKIFKKNIFRIITAFIFWSAVYLIKALLMGGKLKYAFNEFVVGHYHMWFLFMIVGLYMIVPFVKKITESPSLTKYFLLLTFVFAFVLPQIIQIIKLYNLSNGNSLNNAMGKMNFYFVFGYVGYFVLGYCLSKIELSKKQEKIIYIIGIIGFIITFVTTMVISIRHKKQYNVFYNYLTVNVLMESVAVFVFFKSRFSYYRPGEKASKAISALSKYSFGTYLVHPFVMELLDKFLNFNPLSFNAALASLLLFITVSVCSLIISLVLNHIPFLNKYIV